ARTIRAARCPGWFRDGFGASTRSDHVRGPARPGAAWRAPLQSTAHAKIRFAGDHSRQLLLLQHDRRDRSHDRNSPRRRAFLYMSLELEELYQEVILDHSRRPRNFGDLADAAVRVHGDNPACGDEIHLGVKFGPDGELQEIKFTGHGCAISQASASLMTMKLKGKSRADAEEMLRAFHNLVTDETAAAPRTLGDLRMLQGVRKFPQRVNCAMLARRAVAQALLPSAGDATMSTEAEP